MPQDAYRQTYRVESRIRALSQEEEKLVADRLSDWHARARKQAMSATMELAVPLAGAVAGLVYGAVRGNGAVLFVGALMTVMLGVILVLARRAGRARVAASRGPWDAPEGGWKIRETRVFARSVTGAVSDDEDYTRRLLFEIPGGDWFYVDPLDLPALRGADEIGRAEVHLTRLWPHGAYLLAEARGDALPQRGLEDGGDDYARDCEAGRVWRPQDEESATEDLVPEAKLPAWVREACGR
jgi:hypothetical protein